MGVEHRAPTGSGAQAGKVILDDWNAEHTHVPFEVALLIANGNTGHAPAASAATGVELFPTAKPTRNLIDLSSASQVRLTGMVTTNNGTAGATVKLQYRTKATEAVTWAGTDLGLTAGGPSFSVGTGTLGLMRDSGWLDMAVAARANDIIVCAVVGVAWGATSPVFGSLTAYFR